MIRAASLVLVATALGCATHADRLAEVREFFYAGHLDAARPPEIVFQSTAVTRNGDGARIAGNITIRGVTRPITLDATIYRQAGTAAGDLSHLSVHLTGRVMRSAFGATGWADMVADEVRLDILARVDRGS
jgi:polyisoprenoid-binding protein YceI